MPDNTVTLVGNITRDPELRFTNAGRALATFGLAVNRRWQNRASGEWEESTSFFNVTCWGDMGENVAQSVTKGARIIVTGRLEQRSYEANGEKRSVVDVIADEIGPSLRWATATVNRTDRRAPDEGGEGSAASAGASAGARAGAAPDPAGFGDEEPF